MLFTPHERDGEAPFGVGGTVTRVVFSHATVHIGGYTDIVRVIGATEHVDVPDLGFRHEIGRDRDSSA